MKFMSIPGKEWMVTNFNHTVAVAWRPAIGTSFTFTGETNLNVIINSSWNCNFAFNGYFGLSLATTVATLITDNTSCATAGWAGCLKPKDSRAL